MNEPTKIITRKKVAKKIDHTALVQTQDQQRKLLLLGKKYAALIEQIKSDNRRQMARANALREELIGIISTEIPPVKNKNSNLKAQALQARLFKHLQAAHKCAQALAADAANDLASIEEELDPSGIFRALRAARPAKPVPDVDPLGFIQTFNIHKPK